MDYLSGTEISVTFAGTTVHIVGLGFDADNAALAEGLAASAAGATAAPADGKIRNARRHPRCLRRALQYVSNPR